MEPAARRVGAAAALAGLVLALGPAAAAGPADLPTPQEGPAEARRRALEILARPEFRPEPRSLWQRTLDRLGELIGKVIGGLGGGSPVLAWAVVAVVAGLLGFVLWLAVRSLSVDAGTRSGVAVGGRCRSAADWRSEAAGHEAAGRFSDALRCSWRATVADLAARGLVEEAPGRTTGDYRSRVARSLPMAAEPFAQATTLLEDAWYAAVEVGPVEAAQVRELGDQVLTEAGPR